MRGGGSGGGGGGGGGVGVRSVGGGQRPRQRDCAAGCRAAAFAIVKHLHFEVKQTSVGELRAQLKQRVGRDVCRLQCCRGGCRARPQIEGEGDMMPQTLRAHVRESAALDDGAEQVEQGKLPVASE